jgi:hypothetical protein
VLAAGLPLALALCAGADVVPATSGRTTTAVGAEEVGAPLERAFPSDAYARAAAADVEMRWDDARTLYRQAADAWRALERTHPSRALESAIAKAEHEMLLSQALASRSRAGGGPQFAHLPEEARRAFLRRQSLEEGRLLRAKLMSTRALLGRVPAELYTRARTELEAARAATARAREGADAEIALQLCAVYAVGGDPAAARLARAQLSRAERADPSNTLGRAVCAAALGEAPAALAALESFVLRPPIPRPETVLRDVYLINDWDHLRGDPRFESLFR